MIKKLVLTTFVAVMATSSYAMDFSNITPETYATYVSQGASFKSGGNQEHPDLYGREMRIATTNSISLVTPRTIASYLAYSANKRLVQVPSNMEAILEQHNDLLYIATWTPFSRAGGDAYGIGGSIEPQLPTQRLVIDKDGTFIYPTEMPKEIEALMPHSFGVKYYAFPRSVILDAPYVIRWVTGYGDILDMKVQVKNINSLIDDELHFYNAK